MASYTDPLSNLFACYSSRISALEAENTSLRQELAAAQRKPAELRGEVAALQNRFAGINHDLGTHDRMIKRLEGEVEELMDELNKDRVPEEMTKSQRPSVKRTKGTPQDVTYDTQAVKAAKRKRQRDRKRNRKNKRKRSGEDTPAVKIAGTGESSTDLAHRAEETGLPEKKKVKRN